MGVPPTGLLISVICSCVGDFFCGMCCSLFGSFSKTNVEILSSMSLREFRVWAFLGPYIGNAQSAASPWGPPPGTLTYLSKCRFKHYQIPLGIGQRNSGKRVVESLPNKFGKYVFNFIVSLPFSRTHIYYFKNSKVLLN